MPFLLLFILIFRYGNLTRATYCKDSSDYNDPVFLAAWYETNTMISIPVLSQSALPFFLSPTPPFVPYFKKINFNSLFYHKNQDTVWFLHH